MDFTLLLINLFVALVLLVAGVGKLGAPDGFRAALIASGVPAIATRSPKVGVPGAEIVLALALANVGGTTAAYLLASAAVTFLRFTGWILWVLSS